MMLIGYLHSISAWCAVKRSDRTRERNRAMECRAEQLNEELCELKQL